MKIAFTGGGTGGHIYPGLAVIQSLQELDASLEYVWIGEKKGMEAGIVAGSGVAFKGIAAGKLRRYFSLKNLSDLFNIALGFVQAWHILRKERPALLFSKGGFVAVPSVWVASLLGIPIFIHESDYALGLANRLSANAAHTIYVSFAQTITRSKPTWQSKMLHSGSPVRASLLAGNRAKGRAQWLTQADQLLVLVMGGSQGAKAINDLIVEYLPGKLDSVVIVHQTGQLHEQYAAYASKTYHPTAYFHEELADLIAAADVVVSRAGAGAINEFGLMQKAVLLLPLAGHQSDNAAWLAQGDAVRVIYPQEATIELFRRQLHELMEDALLRKTVSAQLHAMIKPDANQQLAQDIIRKIGGKCC
jgi:UDP-N-acetylglucosamine--N-acetylmuramyl-(pentapeptide) pyrophosphoryl-undecaprenol N-acetylglucosamine transferase